MNSIFGPGVLGPDVGCALAQCFGFMTRKCGVSSVKTLVELRLRTSARQRANEERKLTAGDDAAYVRIDPVVEIELLTNG